MIWLLLVLLLILVVLVLLITAWSMWFQGYLYTEPSTGLVWRGPAAAGAIMVVLLFFVIFEYRFQAGEHRDGYYFGPIWSSTSTKSPKPFDELRVIEDNVEKVYVRSKLTGDYHLPNQPTRKLTSRPDHVIVEENGKRSKFEPERDADGNFKRRKNRTGEESLRYVDENRRVMVEGRLGQLETYSVGLFIGNLILNFLLLASSFASLWLLVRFQWPHALGHAVVLTLLILFCAMPPLLDYTKSVVVKRAAPR